MDTANQIDVTPINPPLPPVGSVWQGTTGTRYRVVTYFPGKARVLVADLATEKRYAWNTPNLLLLKRVN